MPLKSAWYRSFKNIEINISGWSVCDKNTRDHAEEHIRQIPKLEKDASGLIAKQMFWPPRVVRAVMQNALLVFFGSGVSFAADLPNWMGLLRKGGLDVDIEKDPYVTGDMLTLAELVAHVGGANTLQDAVRNAMDTQGKLPTIAHNLLAALAQKIYITTNYDNLFEKAWKQVHGIPENKIDPIIITTDDDLRKLGIVVDPDLEKTVDSCIAKVNQANECILFKLHGSVERKSEHLILTRSDYRRHYRTNRLLFQVVKKLMYSGHTLFLGFGHRDPEISRLIDDVVHEFEKGRANPKNVKDMWPGLYSLQFDMQQRTPEVFAARGIVALQPPLVLKPINEDVRNFQLAQGLIDLLHNADSDIHDKLSLDSALREIAEFIEDRFGDILKTLEEDYRERALRALDSGSGAETEQLLQDVIRSFADFSNQGVYLVQRNGIVSGLAVPEGLDKNWRIQKSGGNFGTRPFFRQANSLRTPFVSDSFKSQFNKHSTLAICLPLLYEEQFSGLLFLAYQFRVKKDDKDRDLFADELFKMTQHSGGTLLIVDANGVLLLPPEKEFEPNLPLKSNDPKEVSPEDPQKNIGYDYERLVYLSRRDKRVERIAQNVVPLAQDDDVYSVAIDATVYSVLTELRCARWKVALTRFFPRSLQDTFKK